MKLVEVVPDLVGDIEGALVRLGRSDIADQLRAASVASWAFDDFAQATYLQLVPGTAGADVATSVSLYDDIPVTVDLDGVGRVVGLDVAGYEEVLAKLGKGP